MTRNGVEIAERHKDLTPVDYVRMRQEADEFFGDEDRVGDSDPWERGRS
ncbi:hypothetical protein [Lentzea fradiae]|nr:hypothetical protein [Lentzea fradiae]